VSLFRQSFVTLASRMVITLVNIPISMIIARTLGAEGQGIYSAAVTLPAMWAGIGLCGLDAAHLYFLARDRRIIGSVVANSLVILLGAVVVLFPAYVLLVRPLIGAHGTTLAPYLVLSAVVVPLIVARHLALCFYLAVGQVERYNGLTVVAQLALLVLVALGLLVARGGAHFAIIAYQASLAVFLVPALFWIRRQLTTPDRASVHFSRPLFRESLSYGLKGHLGSILTQFSYRFDTILVLRWLGTAAQGYYSIAVLLAEKLSHITASVQFVLFPRISSAEREEADRITPLVCRATLAAVLVAGGVLLATGRLLLTLFYGHGYDASLAPFQALLPGIVTLTIGNVLSSDLSGRNRRLEMTAAMAIGFALNLVLNFLWIRRFGILGAALASTASYTAQSLAMAVFFWRITGIPPYRLVVPGREDVVLWRGVVEKAFRRR
jgi:O-antigen/teichoic acid export membrane protein